MAKKKTSISIDERLRNDAERIMAARRFANFSDYVEALIRADYEHQQMLVPQVSEPAAEYKAKIRARS